METRDAKHEPRSLAEQRTTWLKEAVAVLGSSEAVAAMVRTVLTPLAETATIIDARWVSQTPSRIVTAMEETRSTWQIWHVRAEAQRHRHLARATKPPRNTNVDQGQRARQAPRGSYQCLQHPNPNAQPGRPSAPGR